MLYLVHGEDEFRRAEWLAEIKQTVALDEGLAALNTATLDGKHLTLEELEAACGALPFLADKRLVIVEGLAARAEPRQGQALGEGSKKAARNGAEKKMADYLASVPPSTDVVLYESAKVSAANVFLAAVTNAGGRIVELQPPKPDSQELRNWAAQRARQRRAQFAPDALDQLVAFVGNNMRLLDQEIAKLATYADGRAITGEDVRRQVPSAREANVFEMVDALGRRDTRTALGRLHELLAEGEAAQHLLFMAARQVRLLIQARDLLDAGLPYVSLASELGVHPFVAQKVGDQARNFSMRTLRTLHAELVELDWAVKTGRLEAEAALDLFIAAAGRR